VRSLHPRSTYGQQTVTASVPVPPRPDLPDKYLPPAGTSPPRRDWRIKQEAFMRLAGNILAVTTAIFLFGCGVWANVGGNAFPEMRGAWVSHALR